MRLFLAHYFYARTACLLKSNDVPEFEKNPDGNVSYLSGKKSAHQKRNAP